MYGGYVDFPECSKRVGDDLIFYHPDRCVPLSLRFDAESHVVIIIFICTHSVVVELA